MMQLSTKIQLYAKEHGQDTIDFFSDVRLQDDGAGPYIKEWNLADIAQPTDADLAAYDQAGHFARARCAFDRSHGNDIRVPIRHPGLNCLRLLSTVSPPGDQQLVRCKGRTRA